jgi:hypothetical protein
MKVMIGAAGMGALLVCAGLGCATTHVRTDQDPTAPLSQYRTFALKRGKVVNEGMLDPRDTLIRDRINAAVQQELSAKGLQPTNLNPDLIVTYTAGEQTQQELTSYWGNSYAVDGYWGVPWGTGYWGGYPSGYAASPYWWTTETHQGTLVIDVIDANTKKLVWRSIARAEGKDFRKPQNIQKAVDKALERFPAMHVMS